MQLKDQQLKEYENDGYLFFHCYFSPYEVGLLKAQLPEIFAEESPSRILEKRGGAVRSVYGSHATNPVFGRLVRHRGLVEPARQILESDVYVHQFKINVKSAFSGDIWQWHQDYIFWRNEDGMRSPRVISAAIFLDEVTEYNGPMFLIPGSHCEGVIEPLPKIGVAIKMREKKISGPRPSWISNLTADLKYSIDNDKITELVNRRGMVAPKGEPGSVLFFHGNIVHGSSHNMSPCNRVVIIITYNSLENIPAQGENPRPDFLASRNYQALSSLLDENL